MACNKGIKIEQVSRSLLDKVALEKDVKIYKKIPMMKLLARQDRVFYEVISLTQYYGFSHCEYSIPILFL